MYSWTSHDLTLGIRVCQVIYKRGRKALIRDAETVIEVPSSAVHETKEAAFIAYRKARALKYWMRRLKYERTKEMECA